MRAFLSTRTCAAQRCLRSHRHPHTRVFTEDARPLVPGATGVRACMLAILEQHKTLLNAIDDPIYTFASPLLHASIGQHTRHSLDHLRKPLDAVVEGAPDAQRVDDRDDGDGGGNLHDAGGVIRYDLRQRNTVIEHDRHAAIAQIERLQDAVRTLDACACEQRLQAAFMLSSDGQEFAFESTLSREMAFAVHHCIHHNALTKVLLRHHFPQVEIPADFGMAPSTSNFNSATTSGST